ncbi:hypothetical protein niasHT_000473 [Heterodera trifolii]|uniref:Uncharacterized protein n=1 Tax=Heterodera trifolii TaxID=157864 RepID=A0ABD2LYW2_9BILA
MLEKTSHFQEAIEGQVSKNHECFAKEYSEMIITYHTDRTKLERDLHRSQGNEALVEFDQRFIDFLRIKLEESRDFVLVLLKLAEEKMDLLLTSSEKQKAKKNEHMSMYN